MMEKLKKKNKQSSLTDDICGEGRVCIMVNEMNLLELLNKKKLLQKKNNTITSAKLAVTVLLFSRHYFHCVCVSVCV